MVSYSSAIDQIEQKKKCSQNVACPQNVVQELVYNVLKPELLSYLQKVIGWMKDQGCDAVILGCTELPLIMNDANSPLLTLDSSPLLAQVAFNHAVHENSLYTL